MRGARLSSLALAAVWLAGAGCNAILGNDKHELGVGAGGHDGGAGAGGAGGGGSGGAPDASSGGAGGAGGADGGAGGAGGGVACGERGQPCCNGACALRASCDGTACIAADVWAGQPDGTYHFNGGTWTQPLLTGSTAPLPSVQALWGTSATFVVGVSASGFVLRNDGNGWHKDLISGAPAGLLYGVSGSSATDVWAVGDTYLAHWNGSSWAMLSMPQINLPYYAVWIGPTGNGWAVGEEATKAYLATGGTWTDMGHSSNGYAYYGIWGSADNDVYAVGQRHTLSGLPLYISHYDGMTWTSVSAAADPGGTLPAMNAVWGSDASHVWVVGGNTVLFWNGSVWTAQLSGAGASENLTAVWGSGPRDVWVVGSSGARHYNGSSWSAVPGLGAATTVWLSPN